MKGYHSTVPGVYSNTCTVWGSAMSTEGLILCLSVSEVVRGTVIGSAQDQDAKMIKKKKTHP